MLLILNGIHMSDTQHPDIEIYIKNRTAEQVLNWISSQAVSVEITKQSATTTELTLHFTQGILEAVLQQKVSGKAWSSLWFKINSTPWPTDLDCAKNASSGMDTQIRCIKESWSEENLDDSEEDQWWVVENGDCELIKWQG